MNNDRWRSLCVALGCEDGVGLAALVAAAEELRAEVEADYRVVGVNVSVIMDVVDAATAMHDELVRLGRYKPGEAMSSSSFRSDRWPPEVDLMAAVDSYLVQVRGVPIEELPDLRRLC